MQISHNYMYIPSLSSLPPIPPSHSSSWSQSPRLGSLCYIAVYTSYFGLPWWLSGKEPMQETWIQSPGWEDPLEREMATHSSIPAWKISWTEESGGLQSMGLHRVGHD